MTPTERAAMTMEAVMQALEPFANASQFYSGDDPEHIIAMDVGMAAQYFRAAASALAALRSCLSSAGETVAVPRAELEAAITTMRISSQPVQAERLTTFLGKEVMPTDKHNQPVSHRDGECESNDRPDTSPRSQSETGGGAFERGARAMREACAKYFMGVIHEGKTVSAHIRALPLPTEPTP